MVKLESKLVTRRNKIGILGGSFDPAHKGHLTISKEAIKRFKLRNVIWAITKKNPFKKKTHTSLDNRIKQWYKWKLISQKCKIIVFDRHGYKKKSLNSTTYKRLNRENLKFIEFEKVNISSSQLRKI